MHKAMYERVHGHPYHMDEKDMQLLADRIQLRSFMPITPLVGDWLIKPDGSEFRLTHDWGDTIQTTVPREKGHYHASFYVGRDAYMSFSGSLDPGIHKGQLIPSNGFRNGPCWFFSHDYPEASNGVYVMIPCRVWRMK